VKVVGLFVIFLNIVSSLLQKGQGLVCDELPGRARQGHGSRVRVRVCASWVAWRSR